MRSPPGRPTPARAKGAFARTDLLAVSIAVGLLAAIVAPAWARSRAPAERVLCANNLRQLGQALLMFSAEHEDQFPTFRSGSWDFWPHLLHPYFSNTNLLRCPADAQPTTFGGPRMNPADVAPRSYLMNGWNDYFESGTNSPSRPPTWLPAEAISQPAATIAFGEKRSGYGGFYKSWPDPGDDTAQLEGRRHFASIARADFTQVPGGSNYTLADGSVCFLRLGEGLYPTNLWAVTERWRSAGYVFPR